MTYAKHTHVAGATRGYKTYLTRNCRCTDCTRGFDRAMARPAHKRRVTNVDDALIQQFYARSGSVQETMNHFCIDYERFRWATSPEEERGSR